MKRFVLIAWLMCTVLIVRAADNVKVGNLWYEVDNAKTKAKVIKAQGNDSYTGSIEIPSTISVRVSEDSEETIDVPVTAIVSYAFQKAKITEITIPASVKIIEYDAFINCSTIEKVTYSSIEQICNTTFVGRYANPLYNASQKHLYISGSQTEVTDLVIPEGVTTIGSCAFTNNTNLTSVKIPSSVREIGYDAFAMTSTSNLTKATFDSEEHLCSIVFGSIAANPLYLAHNLYFGNSKVTEISIPSSSLQDDSFYGKCIRAYILAGATGLTKVTIPADAKRIFTSAFEGCTNLQYAVYADQDQVISMTYTNNTANPLYYAKQLIIGDQLASILEINKDIPDNAFTNAKWLETAIIKEGVTSIGASAFEGCSNLTQIVLPSTMETIGSRAFWGCQNLGAPILPANLKSIGDGVFHDCKSSYFKEISIPDNCYLGEEVFYLCSKLETVKLPEGLDTLRRSSFDKCYNLKNLTLPASVKAIGESAFRDCNKLTVFPTGGSIETIEKYAFMGCSSIESLVLPKTVKYIKDNAFSDCPKTTMVSIPASIEVIGSNAFSGKLKDVFILSTEVPITSPYAVSGVSETTLHVVDNAAVTKFSAVEPWNKFGSIAVKKSSTLTFYINDKKLENKVITLDGGVIIDTTLIPKAPFTEGEIFSGWDKEIPLTMPSEPTEFYGYVSTKQVIGDFKYHLMPAEVKNGANLPARATLLGLDKELTVNDITVTIPGQVPYNNANYPVTAISPNAFKGQTIIQYLNLPESKSIKSIGNAAFMGCSSLTKVENFDAITEVSDSLFLNCPSLTAVTLSDNVTKIGRLSFGYCRNLNLTKLPTSLTTISTQAFANTGIEAVTLSGSITSMGEEVFKECKQLVTAMFDNNFSLPIPKLTFWNCSLLQTVSLSTSTTSILESAFQGCTKLKSFVIPEGITSIAATAFKGCNQLESITMPASITGVGSKTFEDCLNLHQIIVEREAAPFGANDAFPQNVYDESFLFVKNVAEYESKDPWKKFKHISTQDYYTLTYQVDGAKYKEYSFMVGSAMFQETKPTGEGYDGREWSGWIGLPDVMPAKDTVVVGNFEYELKFYENSVDDDKRLLQNKEYKFFCGDKIVLPVEALNKPGFKYTLTNLTTENIFEDQAVSLDMNMPAHDLNAIVTYEPAEKDLLANGINYKVFLLENRAEVVSGTPNATSVNIPASVSYNNKNYPVRVIQAGAFKGYKKLSTVTINNNVQTIGDEAFKECSALTSITMPTSLDSIGQQAFANNTSLTSVIVPNAPKMGKEIFYWCTNLKDISFSPSLTKLPERIFQNCLSLDDVVITEPITEIGDYAFVGCNTISSLTLPATMQKLGDYAFYGVFGKDDILEVNGTTLPKASENTFDGNAYTDVLLKTSATTTDEPWINFINVEGSNTDQCAKPTINYMGGKLKFTFDPSTFEYGKENYGRIKDGVTIISKITIDDTGENSENEVELSKNYIVTAYAKKDGYRRSEPVTKTFQFMNGDVNLNGEINIVDAQLIVNKIVGKIDALAPKLKVEIEPEQDALDPQ